MATTAGIFDPAKSRIPEDKKVLFLRAPWNSPLIDVPGIGPATVKALKAAGVETLYQLAGVFLAHKTKDADQQAWCDSFWGYLNKIKCPAGYRAGLIDCLGEKLGLAFEDIYTPYVPEE